MRSLFDPTDPEIMGNPYPALSELREIDPVHWHSGLRAWVVTRYSDVRDLLLLDDLSAERLVGFYKKLPADDAEKMREIIHYLGFWIAFLDPPDHTRLRRIMRHAFNGRAISAIENNIAPVVDHVLADLDGRERIDFIADYALQIPAFVIMDLLGVPRERLAEFKRWSDDMAAFIGGARRTGDKYDRASRGCAEMAAFFRALVADLRQTPREGFVLDLIEARDEGDALSDNEIVATCILVLFAGHETTTNLIGNAALTLLRHPDQLALFLRDPSLTETAIEEVMRYDGPSMSLVRAVAREHELHGKTLREGDRGYVMITGANRDPAVFPEPDRFDIARAPNRHLTFGQGAHLCIGARLAREEGRQAVRRFFDRFPNAKLTDEPLQWRDAMVPRGLVRLGMDLRGN